MTAHTLMNLVTLALFSILFFVLFALALYVSLKAVEKLIWLRPLPCLRIAILISLIYQPAVFGIPFIHDGLYRLLLNFLGLVSFGFFFGLAALAFYAATRLLFAPDSRWGIRLRRLQGAAFALLWGGSVVLGIYNFHKPETVVRFTLSSDKLTEEVRFVQFTDLHYGTTSRQEMQEKMRLVYAQDPDFIVFVGDLVDFEGYTTDDFSILAESPVPIFFERGNHEFYHDSSRLLQDLESIGPVRLLMNQRARWGEIDIVGIDFGDEPGHLATRLAELPLDAGRFSILLYHEPRDVEVGVEHGFDLLLFGHIHGGQIWPYTLVVDWMYTYADGLFTLGDSTIYTSDGVSLWGPRMRLGSQNEIVVFTLSPQSPN